MNRKAVAKRDFDRLFNDSVPDDGGVVVVTPGHSSKPQKPDKIRKIQPQPTTKTLRLQCRLSTRAIAAFLQNPQLANYGSMQTIPSQIPQRTMSAIEKHESDLCKCNDRGLDCSKQRQKLFNEALNRLKPEFTPLFSSKEIENYADYARGEAGLGDLKPIFEDIENRVIRCALFLGLMKPIRGLLGRSSIDEDKTDRENIREIDRSDGAAIGGHIESEGQDVSRLGQTWHRNSTKTFDKPLPRNRSTKAVIWLKEEIERLRPAGPSDALKRAEEALDELFGGEKAA
jgi:hypothetical protein